MRYTVRDMTPGDINSVASYFIDADTAFMHGMGVDVSKIPPLETWQEMLSGGLEIPLEERIFHFVVWEVDGIPMGHSNINKLVFGEEAWMHLHIWSPETRKLGCGQQLLRESIKTYFTLFNLKRLHCEPYSLNPAPNRVLPKVGFEFVRSHITVPGMLNFEQEVNYWILTRERWMETHAR